MPAGRRRVAGRLASLALVLGLAACATVQPPTLPGTDGVSTWEGRFAATITPADGGAQQRSTGRFALSASRSAAELELISPLGNTIARARADDAGATMTTADGRRYSADSAEALTEQAIGWRVPVRSLPGWLRGQVARPVSSEPGPDGRPRLAVGREEYWEIRVDQWGENLPTRLTLRWPADEPAASTPRPPPVPGGQLPPTAVQLRLIVDRGP